jgi:hypothetical protein
MNDQNSKIRLLKEIGFAHVGNCLRDCRLKSRVRFNIKTLSDEKIMYAFVADNEVKYVGICKITEMTLTERIKSYQTPVSDRQRKIVSSNIRSSY